MVRRCAKACERCLLFLEMLVLMNRVCLNDLFLGAVYL